MRLLLIILLIIIHTVAFAQSRSNLITSSSLSGKLITTYQFDSNVASIYNLERNVVLDTLKSITPISWIGDSTLIYYKDNSKNIEICAYNVINKISNFIKILDRDWFENNIIESDLLSYPKSFLNEEEMFIFYIKDNYLKKLSLIDGIDKTILKVDILTKGRDLNSFSISQDGKNIVFISTTDKFGYLEKYNFLSKKRILIKESKSLKNFDSYVYYTKDDNYIVYYEITDNEIHEYRLTEIIRYDLINKKGNRLGSMKNCGLSIFFEIPFKNSIFSNVFCPIYEIENTEINLNKIVETIDQSFSVKEFKYEN